MIREKKQKNTGDNPPSHADGQGFFKEVQVEFLVHELKDPLSVIETGIRTLVEKQGKYGILSDRQHRTMNRVLRNSARARQLVHDLLEVGRAQAECMTCCSFSPAAAVGRALLDAWETRLGPDETLPATGLEIEEIRPFLGARDIEFVVSPGAETLALCHDEVKFRCIVGNLIKNGLQYRRRKLEVTVARQGNGLSVTVSDDGPGIESRYHEAIFQRYLRLDSGTDTPRGGHGLGLACSRILARSMGGDIQLTSSRGKGAMFRLNLPISITVPGGDNP